MGLLDEAIREHIELRRRGGADPHALAREEREALQPIGDGELPAWAMGPASLEPEDARAEAVPAPAREAAPAGESIDGPALGLGARPASLTHAAAGALDQETVEIDMAALLAQDDAARDDGEARAETWGGRFTARRISEPSQGVAEDEFEWEVPAGRGAQSSIQGSTPQESLAFE